MITLKGLRATALGAGRAVTARLAGYGATGDDAHAADYEGAEVLHPVGFVARPVISDTTEAVVVEDGDEDLVLALVDKGGAAHDCEAGGAQVYSPAQPAARVYARADGSIEIDALAGKALTLRANGASITITALGGIQLLPAVGQLLQLATTNPAAPPIAAGGDAVAGGTTVTPVPTRVVRVPLA